MPFEKGNKAAVGHGRPRGRGFRGVAKKIMRETRDGAELVEHALRVFRSKKTMRHEKWEAMCWLADRAIGKAPQVLDLDVDVTANVKAPKLDASLLDQQQRDALRAAIAIMRGPRPQIAGAVPVIDVRSEETEE
jgi:hypothetical protein